MGRLFWIVGSKSRHTDYNKTKSDQIEPIQYSRGDVKLKGYKTFFFFLRE